MRPKPSRTPPADGPVFEVFDARSATVEGTAVRRLLPHPRRRTVGAWCFFDHFGPKPIPAGTRGMDVAPHPHCGLATVTWLFAGEALHRDSLGSVQRIRPGQLNWMTAGRGISHAEEGVIAEVDGEMHGVQLWVAQPDTTRNGDPRFEHHEALPELHREGLDVTVLVGALGSARSPARSDTALFAYDVRVGGRLTPGGLTPSVLPLDPAFEAAIAVVEGAVEVEGRGLSPGALAYLGTGRDALSLAGSGRVLVLGGEPLDEALLMGWNFVVRDAAELDAAFASWEADDGRFGTVDGARGERIIPKR